MHIKLLIWHSFYCPQPPQSICQTFSAVKYRRTLHLVYDLPSLCTAECISPYWPPQYHLSSVFQSYQPLAWHFPKPQFPTPCSLWGIPIPHMTRSIPLCFRLPTKHQHAPSICMPAPDDHDYRQACHRSHAVYWDRNLPLHFGPIATKYHHSLFTPSQEVDLHVLPYLTSRVADSFSDIRFSDWFTFHQILLDLVPRQSLSCAVRGSDCILSSFYESHH